MKIIKFSVTGMFFFTFMLLFSSFPAEKVRAENLVLTGDADGLKISSNDQENPLAMLFRLDKMTPGDNTSSTITIENLYEYAFSLSVEVKDLHDAGSGLNLSDKFIITVEQDGVELASFPRTNGKYIFPNNFAPKSKSVLKFTVNLPGEVGNEYQETTAELQWIFTATRSTSPPNTPTPTPTPSNSKPPTSTPRTSTPSGTPTQTPSTTNTPITMPPTTPDRNLEENGEVLSITDEIDYPSRLLPNEGDSSESITKIMPKTGETPLATYVSGGALAIGTGFLLLFNSRKKKSKN